MAAMLLFCVGLLLGQEIRVLPEASAQGTGTPGGVKPEIPVNGPQQPAPVPPPPNIRPGLESRTTANRSTDSDSNNRFVAVTCPTVTGESVLFLVDSMQEQVAVYRFQAGQGLEYLASRKIEYDLKVSGYKDISEFSYEQMRQLYQQEVSRQAAKAAAGK
ncbi:MAG TPA: hypothetical protein VFY93_17290 [Planctomycetota bacterium]|nr:hypothetical protein [Planctomycetota bacterium]